MGCDSLQLGHLGHAHAQRKGALIRERSQVRGEMHIRHTPEQYRENLVKLVKTMEKTGAKLVWASTTPIMSRTGKRFEDIKNFEQSRVGGDAGERRGGG